MRKYLSVFAVLIIIVVGLLFVSSGFKKRTDVCLADFSVSEDNSVITLQTLLSGSMGYIRTMKAERDNDVIHCSFYSTFGGLNSSIGSKSSFEIPLDDSLKKIYFDRGNGEEYLVLEKDTVTNVWVQK